MRLLIREDGIIDDTAVERAVRGREPVRLTPLERALAAALILALGGSTDDLVAQLHVSKPLACRLARQARRLQETEADAAAEFPDPALIPAVS